MVINKFISCKAIIDDVFRSLALQDQPNYPDMCYWAFECLGLLNQPLQFIPKVTGHISNPNLDIKDYRAELPCDLYRIEQISVNGLPARYTNKTFHHLLSGACCGMDNGVTATDTFIDNFGNAFSPQSTMVSDYNTIIDTPTYDINDNFLTLSVKEGKVCLAYYAFPTDEQGFPMIPDDIHYKVACTKYLMQKLLYIEWLKDPSSQGKKALFDHAEREWSWYAGKATSQAKIPSIDQMESLKNQLVTLMPNVNAWKSFFVGLGAQYLKRVY